MRGLPPPKYLALYAKVFLLISTIYSKAFLIQGSFLKIGTKFKLSVKNEELKRGQTPS